MHPEIVQTGLIAPVAPVAPAVAPVVETDWRQSQPVLTASGVMLRELRLSDAASLVALLSTEEVSRFISPPPSTVDGFERFILWTQRERAAGNGICFGVVPDGCDAAVGLFQVRRLDDDFITAEWGFVLGMPHWGSGVYAAGALLTMEFAFGTIGVQRLEARAAAQNGRGNGALRKVGAVCEGVLYKSFLRNGEYLDQNLWVITSALWRRTRVEGGKEVN